MPERCLPLTHVLLALPLDEGRRIMRALRVGVRFNCETHVEHGHTVYVLAGEFGERTVRTRPYSCLGSAIVHDVLRQLEPATFPFQP